MKWTRKELDALSVKARYNVEGVITRSRYAWWESTDCMVVAENQLMENVLMVDFGYFHGCVEKLLGRPVYANEFGVNRDGLIAEAIMAIRTQMELMSSAEKED